MSFWLGASFATGSVSVSSSPPCSPSFPAAAGSATTGAGCTGARRRL